MKCQNSRDSSWRTITKLICQLYRYKPSSPSAKELHGTTREGENEGEWRHSTVIGWVGSSRRVPWGEEPLWGRLHERTQAGNVFSFNILVRHKNVCFVWPKLSSLSTFSSFRNTFHSDFTIAIFCSRSSSAHRRATAVGSDPPAPACGRERALSFRWRHRRAGKNDFDGPTLADERAASVASDTKNCHGTKKAF